MTEPASAGATDRRRVGRPARISREMIAKAANEIGLNGLTLRAVADHLDVSIAALYHHVSGKDDLMRLAAEYSAQRVPLPQDRGQHWAVWLLEWATYNRDAFASEPELLTQYLDGAITAEAIAGNVDRILGLLVRQGFPIIDAMTAYELVSSFAIGAAVGLIREQRATEAGTSTLAQQGRLLAELDADDLPHLRELWAESARTARPSFTDRVTTILVGIGLERGEDPHAIRRLVAAASGAADR